MKKVMTLFVRTSGGDIPYDLTIMPSAEDSAVARIIRDLEREVENQKQVIARLSQINKNLDALLSGTAIKLQAFLSRVNEMRVGVSTQVATADSAKSLLPASSSEEEELFSGSAYSADDDDPSKGRSQSPNIFKRGSALPGMRDLRLSSSPSF